MKPNNLLFICFNRPDLVSSNLVDLLDFDWDNIVIACDGWRTEEEKKLVIEVRDEVLRLLKNHPGNVHYIFREYNYGCRRNIEHALEFFFKSFKQGWVFEDDIKLTKKEEFGFLRNNWEKRGHLSLYNPLRVNTNKVFETSLAHFFIWGWYLNTDSKLTFRDEFNFKSVLRILRARGILNGSRFLFLYIRTLVNKIDTWDSLYTVWAINKEINLYVVSSSLIENCGFDSRATHTLKGPELHKLWEVGVDDKYIWKRYLKKWL